jgi:small subunit ribosomal protein S16
MLVIRLSRTGKRNSPSFRVVLQEKHRTPTGKAVEFLGYYNPRLKEKKLKTDRIKYWLDKGAQPSGSIHNLLVTEGILKTSKVKVSRLQPKKKKTEDDESTSSQEKAPASQETDKKEPSKEKEVVANSGKEDESSNKENKSADKKESTSKADQEKNLQKEESPKKEERQTEDKKEEKDQSNTSQKDK